MRVLHVVPTYLPATRYGGPIYSVHGLCKALAADGHEVHVFTTNVDGAGDSDVPLGVPVLRDGVHVWYFPSRWLRRLYWSSPMMRALKAQLPRFDVVHLHSVFLWPTWAAARVARAQRVPYVLSPRGMLVRDLIRRKSRCLKSAWIGLIERRNLRNAAAIHVTSGRERRDLEELGLALSRVEVIPNGVDVAEMPVDVRLDTKLEMALAKGPCVLYLGRLSWKKGLDRLIRSWGHVRTGHLLIAGNDDENLAPQLRAMIEECGLEGHITLVSRRVGDDEKRLLFGRVRVTVLPSYSENFGNVVLEAMAAGCPVVVTPQVGATEVVLAARGGLVAEGGELAAALDRLLGDEAEATQMGRHGRDYVAENHSWSGVETTVAGLYLDVATAMQEGDSALSPAGKKGR
jgi:glycosyltransferase involved in cell wall biosynthesis